MESGRRPLTAVTRHINRNIRVKLKNGTVYEGTMTDCDVYMNIVMAKAVEFSGGDKRARYSSILIRGNNVLYIQLPSA